MRPVEPQTKDLPPTPGHLRPTAAPAMSLLASGRLGERLLGMARAAAAIHMAQTIRPIAPSERAKP